jgi:chromosome segregation ATPase
MKEKIKILTNEIEILRHEISSKDRDLARKKQENSAAYAIRDSLRNEANKLMHQYKDKRDQIDHRLSRIETLNANINAAEEQMMRLKEKYEQSVKDRNQSGVQLLDRNDELCILYERINIQKEIMGKGAASLNDREDEIRRLELILTGLHRKIELEKQKKPLLQQYHKEIAKLEKEREHFDRRLGELSARMENPDDPSRCRNLGGEDPDQDHLSKKIEKLETLLVAQEVYCSNKGKNLREGFSTRRSIPIGGEIEKSNGRNQGRHIQLHTQN